VSDENQQKGLLHIMTNTPDNENSGKISISKPLGFDLEKFKSKRGAAVAAVATLQTGFPVHNIAAAKDFVRLHPDEDAYWISELCFVSVPIKGQKQDTLHLIEEELAMEFLPSARVQRFGLALAAKPFNVFFLCIIPTQHLDNSWVMSNVLACEEAKTRWVQATSRKAEGVEAYKVDYAKSETAFALPEWPKQTMAEILAVTFGGTRMISDENHPGLLRLIGAEQSLS